MPLSEKHREAVRQSNYRRSEQTREMNRNRVWTPEMRAKLAVSQKVKNRERMLKQAEELGLGRGIYSRWINSHGYVMVSVIDHPVVGTCSISEHRLTLAERLGRRPTPTEVGHHRDEIKTNNDDANIELTDPSSHSSHHAKGRQHTEEFKRRVSEKLKGRIITEEHRQKLRDRVQPEDERRRRGDSVRATLAAKRAAGNHLRGPDSDEVRARKKQASIEAWARRRAARSTE